MSRDRDPIPSSDSEFNTWFKRLVDTVVAKTSGQNPRWDHIPQSEVENLTSSYTMWTVAYEPTLKPHVPSQTLAKNEARKAAEKVVRPFIAQWLMFHQVSDEEREDVGVHNPKTGRDPVPAPSTVPELSVSAGLPRQIVVAYRDKGSTHRGKPEGIHGIEIRWALLDKPPTNIKELTNSSFDTNSPLSLDFEEEDRGKRIYLVGCWEIEREGIKGKFGDIVSAVIP
jgi:hypothetical protein